MKDSPEANFQIHSTIFYHSKIDKQICKIKYTSIYMKDTCFLPTQQFYDIRQSVLIQIHASTYMLKSFDYQEGKQVRHNDCFQ